MHLSKTLPSFPCACYIVTITFDPHDTKSIAPPMPFNLIPGISQLEISPVAETCIDPSTVISKWPPRIIPNESDEEKKEDPGIVVTVSFHALIRSGLS